MGVQRLDPRGCGAVGCEDVHTHRARPVSVFVLAGEKPKMQGWQPHGARSPHPEASRTGPGPGPCASRTLCGPCYFHSVPKQSSVFVVPGKRPQCHRHV